MAGTGTGSAGADSGGSGGATSAGGGSLAGGSGGSSTAGATSGESGSSSAAGSDGAAGSSGGPLGSITIYSMVFNGSQAPLLNVAFPATSSGAATSTCTSTPYGSCAVTDCTASSSTTTTTRLSAGTINVDSDAANVHLSATPDANGNYTQVTDTSAVQFRGGEAFTVTGTGAAIPSFTTSGTYPLLLIMTGPPPPTGVSQVAVSVPRSAPATLTWQRGASGGYLVTQTNGSVPSGSHTLSLYCQVDSLPGTMTIPMEALSAFPSGTELELYTVSQSRVQAGTQDINIWAVGDTITADKMARVELTLE